MSTYNGWRNWATWNANLEFFDGRELTEDEAKLSSDELAEILKEELTNYVDESCTNSIVKGWVYMAYIADVDYREIASSYLDIGL